MIREERYGFPYWRGFLWLCAVVMVASLSTCWRVM